MIVMPHPYGRMANRLVLSTAFIIHAEETGDTFLHLAFADYFRFFEGTRHSPFLLHRSSAPARHRKTRAFGCVNIWNTYDKRNEIYPLGGPEFLALQHETRLLFVVGWSFRSDTAIGLKHKPLVRRIFTPVARHREAVARLTDRLRTGADQVVGVHIRQTDYQSFANGRYFYPLTVYRRVMSELAAQLPGRTRFLLCSDAPLDPAAFAGLDVLPANGHFLEDNYALAACDYIVGPPSTYTAWASYYGDVPKCFIETPDASLTLDRFQAQTTI